MDVERRAIFDKCLCQHRRRRRRRVVISHPTTRRVGAGRPPPPSKKKAESPQPESMPSPADGDLLLNDRIGCSAPMQIGPSRPTKGRRNLNKTQKRANVVSSERAGGGGKNYSNDVTRLRHLVRKFPLLLTVSADCEFAYQYCG